VTACGAHTKMNLRSAEFHLVEATNNVRRNGLMAISAVTNSAACLFVLGAFLLGWWNFARLHERLSSETRVTIYMRKGVPTGNAQALVERLIAEHGPLIAAYRVVSPEEAIDAFLAAHPQFPREGLRDRPPVGPSIEIQMARPEEFATLDAAARTSEEVDEVLAGQEILQNLVMLRRLGTQVGTALLVLLGAAALLTISNTIRLTIYARRREIDVMQMVGATRSFIRAPFSLEGMFHGMSGAVIGGGVLVLGYANLRAYVTGGGSGLQFLDSLFAVGTMRELGMCWLVLIGAGCLFGLMGSWLSVARYLHT